MSESKKYEAPEFEIISFEKVDIVTDSFGDPFDPDE